MKFVLDVPTIATIVGAPEANVQSTWPTLLAQMELSGMGDGLVQIGVIATVGVECPPFKPINEYGNDAYFTKHYEGRADLGNTHPGDGALFHGRGLIQITGRSNYLKYSSVAGVDLLDNPDAALDPDVAAKILVAFFREHRIAEACMTQDWQAVRRKVNGGLNGWDRFSALVSKLQYANTQAGGE